MINIVVADDDEVILRWMKKNIEELSSEYKVTDCCLNGKQVLNRCFNEQIDVLFLDIRMPVLDGIEVLRKLDVNQEMPYTVILSGYDDFYYARDCFKLGVEEFLLKSEITKEILEKCLQNAVHRFNQNKQIGTPEDEMILNAEPELVLQKEKIEKYGVILLHNLEPSIHQSQQKEILSYLFQEENIEFYWFSETLQTSLILVVDEEKHPGLIQRVYQLLVSFWNGKVCAGIAGGGSRTDDFIRIKEQAYKVIEHQRFYKYTAGMTYDELEEQEKRTGERLNRHLQEMQQSMSMTNWTAFADQVQTLFGIVKIDKPPFAILRKEVLNILLNLYWDYLEKEQRAAISIDALIELSHCTGIKELEIQALEQIQKILQLLMAGQNQYSESITKVLRYIDTHYEMHITLDELANHVNMNRTYISNLFKKETGKNIYTYLQEVRLEMAKKLLRVSKNNIQEISSQVGVPDSAYFSKIFKKYTGMTPMEYRRMPEEQKRK